MKAKRRDAAAGAAGGSSNFAHKQRRWRAHGIIPQITLKAHVHMEHFLSFLGQGRIKVTHEIY